MEQKVFIKGFLGNYWLENEDGDVLVDNMYLICDFCDGYSIVKKTRDSKCQFMDKTGRIYPQSFYDAGFCAFGYAPVQNEINGTWRYVKPATPNQIRKNENGKAVVNTFSEAYSYSSNGFALVKTGLGYQYIDTDGAMHGEYKKAEEYIRGFAWVMPKGETSWRILDSTGRLSKKSFDEEFKSMHSNPNQVVEAVMNGSSSNNKFADKDANGGVPTISDFLGDKVEVYDLDAETIYNNFDKIVSYLKGKSIDRPTRYKDALLYAKEQKEAFEKQQSEKV